MKKRRQRGWTRAPLTDIAVRRLRLPIGEAQAEVRDGGAVGLFLRIGRTWRSFIYRWWVNGLPREITLGPAGEVFGSLSLIEARQKAAECHALVKSGGDPRALAQKAQGEGRKMPRGEKLSL